MYLIYSSIRSRAWFVPGVLFLLGLKDIPKNRIGSNFEIDNAATDNKSLLIHIAYDACIKNIAKFDLELDLEHDLSPESYFNWE